MKKTLTKKLCIVILSVMLITLFLNYFLQVRIARQSICQESKLKIDQIEEILNQNEIDIEELKASLKEDYIIRAKAAANLIQYRQDAVHNQKELKKMAKLLQVDELHLFNTDGEIYAGTHPEYWGYTFHSGTQMEFFLPMLEDTSLEMAQDITPNTAEHKLMQYTAVWQEDKKAIVQIGMEPRRLVNAMEKNELSYIFSKITKEKGTSIFAINKKTGIIAGSTNAKLIGKQADEIGLSVNGMPMEKGFSAVVAGEKSYCVFSDVDSYLIGVAKTDTEAYHSISRSMLLVAIYLFSIAALMIISILYFTDRDIIRNLDDIMIKVDQITSGNLDTVVDVKGSPELVELGEQINKMVKSLLDTTNKLSQIFDAVEMPVGVYEYTKDMKRVLGTKKLKDLLVVSEEAMTVLLSDRALFEKKLETIRQYPLEGEQNVFLIPGTKNRYVKILSFVGELTQFGIIMDVTSDISERQKIIYERDYDLLTEIYTRRAFYARMNELFEETDQLHHAAMIMVDMDNLKFINDNFGHLNGDSAIQAIAKELQSCPAKNKIVGRLSGDEFAVFIYGCDTKEELEKYIEQYRAQMKDITAVFTDGNSFGITFSAGYVFYPDYNLHYKELLRISDQALYEAKRKGKATFYQYED